ncbi:MAG: nucleotidyltransferase domain-containing protein [Acidobacteria bacterium]|nr:nucleotidyltransferase domain-containing protein [Acidobacteriota bacterium]
MDSGFGVDLERARAFQAEKERRREARIDARFEQATRDADAIVAAIAEQVNPRRIYQWGSLLDRPRFSEISDIDLAVEGLSGPAEFFRTLGIAMDGTNLPVDVIELEKVPEDIAERIRSRGAVVHERRDR